MSVTFRVDPGRALGYRATHVCGATGTVVFPATEAGLVAASTGEVPGCVDTRCGGDVFPSTVHEFDGPQVDVSNSNARVLLDTLGVAAGDELAGAEAGEVFLGRVLLALAVAPADAGVPAHASGAGNVVECGRREGYVQERLLHLHAVAEAAARAGRDVIWY